MKKKFNSFTALFFFPLILLGQSKNTDCSSIKKGTFYFYPPKSQTKFSIVRSDSIQQEINPTTVDTSFWKIKWQSDCIFNLKFIRKGHPIPNEERDFYKSHILTVEILSVTKDYYTFKAGIEPPITVSKPLVDTLWYKAK